MMTEYEIRDLAYQLMNKHGLITAGWRFEFDRAKRRVGCCKHRQRTISLSTYSCFKMSFDEVKDVLLHEIAHYYTPGDHHGWRWRSKAREIGANPQRICQAEFESPTGKYIANCSCTTHHVYRRPKLTYKCGKCGDRLEFRPTGL